MDCNGLQDNSTGRGWGLAEVYIFRDNLQASITKQNCAQNPAILQE